MCWLYLLILLSWAYGKYILFRVPQRDDGAIEGIESVHAGDDRSFEKFSTSLGPYYVEDHLISKNLDNHEEYRTNLNIMKGKSYIQ